MAHSRLELFAVPGIPLIKPGDDLGGIIAGSIKASGQSLEDGDVLVIAQKLVSKAEYRIRRLSEVKPSPEAIELAAKTDKEPAVVQLILDESIQILRHRPGVLISEHKLGIVLANAGIDRSNVSADQDLVLLLPEDPDKSSSEMRAQLEKIFGLRLAVVIVDSVGRAWRMGTTGMALGSSGVEALANLRGEQDLFGRVLQVSEHAIADSIASAAELLMGEANESTPVIVLRGLDQGHSTQTAAVLLRPAQDDMFR